MRNVFIINPAAGKGMVQKSVSAAIEEYCRAHEGEYEVLYTKAPGDARRFAEKEAKTGKETRIFACGGEGTSFEVINGIAGCDNITLGVIPCGSANDFLKVYGEKAAFLDIDRQLAGHTVSVDLIKAGEYFCLNVCSAGMDAMVANDMQLFKRWPLVSGHAAYNLAIIKNFVRKLGVGLNITLDGVALGAIRCLFVVIANAPVYGGGYVGAPKAKPDDGELDFTLVKVISRFRVPKFLSVYKKGEQEKLSYCSLKRCRVMEFVSKKVIPVNLDGEIIYTDKMRFEVVPGGLKFSLPEYL